VNCPKLATIVTGDAVDKVKGNYTIKEEGIASFRAKK
jgi:hypothetical protein